MKPRLVPGADHLLRALRAAVGAEHVDTDGATLAAYASSTAARGTCPRAVAHPVNAQQVAALLRIASAHRLAVYPISTGKNWGYGDACAMGDGQLLIDLARMNRIIEVDPALAYALIEPGVTQAQLANFLEAEGIALQVDCTGAGPDTSFLGNILERGFGHSPYGNRLQHVSGLQIVLANGEVLETGFGHYRNARASHLFPYGVGPFLDGLFTQSNMGVVTRIGLWLMPKAQCVEHFIISLARHGDVAPVVDALRPLRLDGSLRSIVHIGNDLRVLSGGRVSPGAMTAEQRASLCQAAGIGAWTVSGALYGSARQVAAARHALRAALRATPARLQLLTDGKLRAAGLLARALGPSPWGRRLCAKLALGHALLDMNRGRPDGRFLAGAYWRRRAGLPPGFPKGANPARDRCGLMWISPVLPMRGHDVLALHALVEGHFAAHGFELFITCSMLNERALGAVLTIAFDQDDAAEVARARQCYTAVFDAVMGAGYIPYRVGQQSMCSLDPDGDVYWKTVARIKAALDPGNIIAPGRYAPWQVP